MDGWITIGTTLDDKPLDKRIRKLEAKLKNEEIDLNIKAKDVEETKRQLKEVEITMRNISNANEESRNRIKSLSNQYSSFNKRIAEGEHLTVEEYQRYGYLSNEISKLQSSQQEVNKEMDKYNSKFNKLNDLLTTAETAYDKQKNKVTETKQQVIDLNNQIKKNNLENVENKLKNISTSTENVIKKVAKWGLAIFSVRSAYMFIRQSVSTLSQYNEKLATDIEYIRYALASSLQPIIERIIQLIYRMMAYINYISQAWFGINIFANASAKAFNNVKKGLSGANKQAKELQKTLLGFDEMNILQDGSTKTGGGGGGITLPSMDLANMQDVPIPSWIKWIADNGPYVVTILGAIGAALVAIKLTTFIGGLMGVTEGLSKFAAGAGVLVAGLVLMAGSIARLIINWDELSLSQKQASVELASIGGALVALGLTITGIVSGPIGLLIGAFSLLAGGIASVIIKNNEDENSMISAKDATNQLRDAKDKLRESNNRYINALDNAKKASNELKNAEKELQKATGDRTITGEKLFASVLAGTKTVDNMTKAELAVYKAYLNNQSAQKELTEANKELDESRKKSIEKSTQEAAAIYQETGKYNEYFQTILDGYKNKSISESQMLSATAKIYSQLDEEAKKTFAQNLPENIKQAIDSNIRFTEVLDNGIEVSFKEISNASKKTFATDVPNNIQKSIDKVSSLSKGLDKIAKTGSISITTAVKSISGSKNAKGAVYYPPKLATGGIINMPGRGVPLGAIGGERGAEGVIPLTDSQMMAQLGEAIGRNVVINTILNNYMNSRLISREQQKTNNVDSFAFNG